VTANNKKLLTTLLVVLGFLVAAFLIFLMIRDLWPLMHELITNRDDEQRSVEYVKAYGARGVPILIGIEIILAMIGIIPAAPVHILAGLCYGIWLGSLIAMTGIIVGNSATFFLFRQFHKYFHVSVGKGEKRFFSVEKINKMKHPEIMIIVACMIPIFPSFATAYTFAKTKIPFWRYIATIAVASFPSVLIFSLTGKTIARGDWDTLLYLLIAIVLVVAIVFFSRKWLMKKLGKSVILSK
jgi:uncharacterized membrane protein YdjX (TVP38/TMEM64 family)